MYGLVYDSANLCAWRHLVDRVFWWRNRQLGATPRAWFLFPVVFGVLVLGGLYFRDERLRALIPVRSAPEIQRSLKTAIMFLKNNLHT